MASVVKTGQSGDYVVKNTFLSTFPDAPNHSFFRMQSCPGNISNEPTMDSLPFLDSEGIYAPELDDVASSDGSASLSDVLGQPDEAQWRRQVTAGDYELESESALPIMQVAENGCDQVRLQQWTSAAEAPFAPDCGNSMMMLSSHPLHGGYSAVAESSISAPLMMPSSYPVTPYPDLLGEFEGKSTVMMKNLPNKYNRALLLEELGRTGFNGTYDFVYIPWDVTTQASKGYAFINFISPAYAKQFKEVYEDCSMPLFNSSKLISVSVAALQGFEANYAHYSRSRCNKGDPATRPLFLRECLEPAQPFGRRRPLKMTPNSGEQTAKFANGGKFCKSCGAGCQSSHRFCIECGHALIGRE